MIMTYANNAFNRFLLEEQRRLLREVSSQRMSWSKLGRMIRLSALLRMNP